MSSHPDLGPELRQLAQAILDRLDPAMRAAATFAAETLRGPGRCQQVWCPVCALAALVSGEQHPLLTVIADHSVALMAVVRAMAAEPDAAAGSAGTPPPPAEGDAPPAPPHDAGPSSTARGYQDIPIVVEDLTPEDWP